MKKTPGKMNDLSSAQGKEKTTGKKTEKKRKERKKCDDDEVLFQL